MIENGLYKHFKGGEVFVFGTAKTPEDTIDVLYKGIQNGKIYARPLDSFLDEVKNADGEIVKRFSLVQKADIDLIKLIDSELAKQEKSL